MELAVKSVVTQDSAGVIFTGETCEGQVYRVRVREPLAPVVGETYDVEGRETEFRDSYNRRFRQIEAAGIRRTRTSGRLLIGFLTTISDVGDARAKRLLDAFGDRLHEVLRDPDAVEDIAEAIQPGRPTLGRKLAGIVQAEFAAKVAADDSCLVQYAFYRRLEALGLDNRAAARALWRLLGSSQASDALVANPYLAAALLPWGAADALGQAVLRSQGNSAIECHPERLRGAVDAATRKLLAKGHTAASPARWRALAPKGVAGSKMVSEGLESGLLVQDRDVLRPLGARYVEEDVAQMLHVISANSQARSSREIIEALELAERKLGFQLTGEQRSAVAEIVSRPLACLQGGAGVGKTTVMSAVTESWEILGGSVVMAALAGKAALQLSRATSRAGSPRLATTITRLISQLRGRREGKVNADLPEIRPSTLFIIDEASMVDTGTLHELLDELRMLQPSGICLLLVGDAGQLPPVGFGAIFHSLVRETSLTSQLTTPHRQAAGSVIPVIASQVRRGDIPQIARFAGQREGVQFAGCAEAVLIKEAAVLYRHVREYTDVEDVMVCAARNSTVEEFNKLMCADNWEEAQRLSIFAKVHPGDPVICTKNHYEHGLFNGLLGIVRNIDDEIMIAWDGGDRDPATGQVLARRVPPEANLDVKLAYAITCHKSQGSAARVVIVLLEDTELLTREWLYTAITRAKQQVVIVGATNDLAAAVRRRTERLTGFRLLENAR